MEVEEAEETEEAGEMVLKGLRKEDRGAFDTM